MARTNPLGERLERARIDAGLTRLEARRLIPLSETKQLDEWERGEVLPTEANLQRVVDVYTATDAYMDGSGMYAPGESEAAGMTAVPPDVLIRVLLELREHVVIERRVQRRKRLAGGIGSILAAASLGMPTAANATSASCQGCWSPTLRGPRMATIARTSNRTSRRATR